MSKSYNLIFIDNGKLKANQETITYLQSIKEKIILIGLISTTDDSHNYSDSIKLTLLSNMMNSTGLVNNPITQSISLYPSSLEKDNYNSKIFVLDINISNNKHIFSLCFFICSLFVFCFDEYINKKELSKFKLINSLPSTIKLKGKSEEQKSAFLGESSPKLIFFIPNSKSSLSNYYLEEELQKKDDKSEINSLKLNIKKFFPKRELYSEPDERNAVLIRKIIEKSNPKEINGKLFDGNALAFFIQNFCEMHNNKVNPDFDLLFGNTIYNDLQTFKNKSLKYFEDKMKELENDNEEYLIPQMYDIRLKSIEIYNFVQSINYKIFNNTLYQEYKSSFNSIKKELEKKFTELENQKLIENLTKSELKCNELLKKLYETIHKKMVNGEYNKENTAEFLEDYQNFLSAYEKEAKGNNKIKCLINFLEINQPKYFNSLIYNEKKIKKEYKDMFEDEENIEELKIKLNRKKREIEGLKKEIKKVGEDIKKAQSLENDASSKQFQNM